MLERLSVNIKFECFEPETRVQIICSDCSVLNIEYSWCTEQTIH